MKACTMHTMFRRRFGVSLLLSAGAAGALASTWSCSSSDSSASTDGTDGGGGGALDGGPGNGGDGATTPADCSRTLRLDARFAASNLASDQSTSEPKTLAVALPGGGVLVGSGGALAKLGADGQNDATFVPDQLFFDPDHPRTLQAATVDATGRVLVVFTEPSTTSTPPIRLARLGANGALDTTYGQGGTTTLPLSPDAGVVNDPGPSAIFADAAGALVTVRLSGVTRVYRVDANGALAASYGNSTSALEVPGNTIGLAPRADGHAMLGLALPSVSRAVVISLDPNGLPEPSFAGDGGLAPEFLGSGGRLLGLSSGDALLRGSSIAKRLRPDGTFDLGFGTLGELTLDSNDGGDSSSVLQLAPRGDGSFVAFGKATASSGAAQPFIARYDASGHACGSALSIGAPAASGTTNFYAADSTAVAYGADGTIYLVQPAYDDAGAVRSVAALAYREAD
jgi:hypothetical protein